MNPFEFLKVICIKWHFGRVCGHKLDKNHFYKIMNQDQLVTQELLLLKQKPLRKMIVGLSFFEEFK